MPATSINVRSPRIVDISGTANQATKLELFIWNDPDSIPANPTYTLEKPIPSSIITECSYDISPFCREYIEHISYVEVNTDTAAPVGEYCYCTVKEYLDGVLQSTTEYICFDGFGYHADGENPSHGDEFLTDGDYYIKTDGTSGGVFYYDDQSVTWQSRYTGLQSGTVVTTALSQVVGYIPYINVNFVGEGNKLEIIKDGVVQNTYFFYEQEECKFETINCDFVNMHGAWQRLVFFKLSKSTLEMTNTEYDLLPKSTSYNIKRNVRSTFNTNGTERITCNTGWVFESYSEVIKQLMMSEKILIDDVPVLLSTKGVSLKKSINDKNINYELEFRYSAPLLQYNL